MVKEAGVLISDAKPQSQFMGVVSNHYFTHARKVGSQTPVFLHQVSEFLQHRWL